MRLLSTIALVACGVLLTIPATAAKPPPAPSQVEVINFPAPQNVTGMVEVTNFPMPPSRFQLVGFTNAMLLGGEGVLGFTVACEAEFFESRMCTSEEVLNSVGIPAGIVGSAWVRPVFVILSSSTADISGIATGGGPQGLTSAWGASTNAFGLAVDAKGSFRPESCGGGRSVACCALVP